VSPDVAAVPWTENSARRRHWEPLWAVLWHGRQLIGYLALRDIRLRYRQAALGVIWVLVQPVATVIVFTFVFQRLARVGSEGLPYPLFALTGLVTWTYFSSATLRASEVLVGNPNLVTKVYLPRLTVPVAGLLSPVVDLAVSFSLFAVLCAYYGVWPGWNLLAAPLWLFFLLSTTLGVSLWLSAVNVRYRDVRHAVGPILQLWLFVSPVAYSASQLGGWQELLYSLNPVAGVIELGRWSLLGAPWPGWSLLVSLASSALVLATGLAYFRRAERSFADVI
jgi:ABC-2 type transport system permease protein/lipopolysaccharide transport system permease protein